MQGGDAKSMKAWTSLDAFLKSFKDGSHEANVRQLIKDLGLQRALIPRRDDGVTLLMPDAAYLAKMTKIAESAEPEPATDMMLSCIIRGMYMNAKDFETKTPVVNQRGFALKVTDTRGKAITVEGESGKSTITLDEKFHPFQRIGNRPANNLAVWRLSGDVKLDTEKVEKKQQERRSPNVRAPSTHATHGGHELQICVRELAEKCRISLENMKEGEKPRCPILAATCKVLHHLREHAGKSEECMTNYRHARSLITQCGYLNFFILFTAPTIFDPECIKKCLESDEECPEDMAKFLAEYNDADDCDESATCSSRLLAAHHARNDMVDELVAEGKDKAKRNFVAAYEELTKKNKLGDVDNIYPASLAKIFASHTGYKQMLDEAYCWIYERTKSMHDAPSVERAREFEAFILSFQVLYPKGLEPHSREVRGLSSTADMLDEPTSFETAAVPYIMGCSLRLPTNSAVRAEGGEHQIIGGDDDDESDPTPVSLVEGSDITSMYDTTPIDGAASKKKAKKIIKRYLKKHNGKLPKKSRALVDKKQFA